MTKKTTHSSCYMCSDDCPITVVSDGDRILSVDHPKCIRAEGMIEQRESPARLVYASVSGNYTDTWSRVSIAETLEGTAGGAWVRDSHRKSGVRFH